MPKKPSSHALVALLTVVMAACGGGNHYQNLDADQLFQTAQTQLADGKEDNALLALDRLVAAYPNYARLPEAQLMRAKAYYKKGEYLTARSEYQHFEDRFAGDTLAADAALGQCQSLAALSPIPQRDQQYTEEAISVCGSVAIDFANTPQAKQALDVRADLHRKMAEKEYLNAEHYYRRKQYDPAIIYFQFVVDDYGDTEYASRALLGIYRSNLAIGYKDLADEAKTKLLNNYPDSPEAKEVKTGSAP
jgi:outer membrane protein assembly factor BamD